MRRFAGNTYRLVGGLVCFACLAVPLAQAASNTGGIKCHVGGAQDSEASGLTAFKFLVPEGWQAHSSFKWLPPDQMTFASDLSLSTPDLHAIVDCVEHTVLTYRSGFGRQPGSGIYMGKATDFLRFRASKLAEALPGVTDFAIVNEVDTELEPDVAQQAGERYVNSDSMHSRTFLHQAGYLKVRFKLNGVDTNVDLGTEVFGETSVVRIPGRSTPSSVMQVNRVGPTLTIMLPADASPNTVSEAKVIASSFQMTPEFHAYWVQRTTHAAKVKLGVSSAEAKAANMNWHERSMASFRKQMEAKSGTTHDFCNMVADQQDYKLGNGIVTLPNKYKGWYDARAHVLMVDEDPNFVPTGAGTKNFRELQAVHAGQK